MTSIAKNKTMRITSSAATGRSICLVLTDSVDVDDDTIVLIHRSGEEPAWSRLLVNFDVVDVCPTPAPLQKIAEYVCVASTGEAIFLAHEPIVERINEPTNFERIGIGTGMLSAIRAMGERLFSTGRGGQAYVRTETAQWVPAAATFPIEEYRDDHINLSAGAMGPGANTMTFGGTSVPDTGDGGERARLLIAGDMDAYKRALRKIRRNYGTLWMLRDNKWIKVPLPTEAVITDLLTDPGHGVFASTSSGSVSRISSEDEIETIYSSATPRDITDLSVWDRRLVILHSDELVAHDFVPASEVTLASPEDFKMMTNFHSNEDVTWLVDGRGLAQWSGSDWQEIRIPPALIR
jgi:hypothetical protein